MTLNQTNIMLNSPNDMNYKKAPGDQVDQVISLYQKGAIEEALASAQQLIQQYPDTPTIRSALARHYNNIQRMAAPVGRILAALADESATARARARQLARARRKKETVAEKELFDDIDRRVLASRPSAGRPPDLLDECLLLFPKAATWLLLPARQPKSTPTRNLCTCAEL